MTDDEKALRDQRDQALAAAERATEQAERYANANALVAISDALPNVNRVRLIIAGLDTNAR